MQRMLFAAINGIVRIKIVKGLTRSARRAIIFGTVPSAERVMRWTQSVRKAAVTVPSAGKFSIKRKSATIFGTAKIATDIMRLVPIARKAPGTVRNVKELTHRPKVVRIVGIVRESKRTT